MKITKEQIVQLDKGETSVRELFPEVFETKLEVRKWYNANYKNDKYLVLIKDTDKEKINTFGFISKEGKEYAGDYPFSKNYDYNWTPATKEEVETALINEAKKRGFNNIDTLSIKVPNLKIYPKGFFARGFNTFEFDFEQNVLEFSGVPIFDNGTWAEIIKPKQMTKEEIEKEIGYEIEIKS